MELERAASAAPSCSAAWLRGCRHIISVAPLLPEVCDGGESLESRDKEALSPGHCEQCVGGCWGHRRDKRPACVCVCVCERTSHSGLDLPQPYRLRDGQEKEQTGTDGQKLGCGGGPVFTGAE